jgi:SAM-dependent methyltransferase
MNPFLKIYAQCYDSIHIGKEYEKEASSIICLLEKNGINLQKLRVLDFGAGTGMHAKALKTLDISVEAYEPSTFMAERATENCASLKVYTKYSEIEHRYQLVLSLFDVLSYQATKQDLNRYLKEISNLLTSDGYFLFDSWHTPGVLLDPPTIREKQFEHNGEQWMRTVTPLTTGLDDVFDLKIELSSATDSTVHYSSKHKLKSYSIQEIEKALTLNGFEIINFGDTTNWDTSYNETNWRFWILARKM